MASITIDPGSLRNGARAIQTCRDGLHGVADRVRGMGHPEGISGETIAAMNGGVGRIHAIGLASEVQMAYLVQTANAADRVGGFGASLLSAFALNLRTPFPIKRKPPEKVPWHKRISRNVKTGVGAAGDFAVGAGGELWNQAKGLGELAYIGSPAKVKEAIDAAEWIAASPENREAFLKELAKSQYADIAKDWQNGEKSKAAGAAAVRAGLTLIPVAKIAQLAKLGKVVKLAQKASEVAKKVDKVTSAPARTINGAVGSNLRKAAIAEAKTARRERAALNENSSISPQERISREAEIRARELSAKEKLRKSKEAAERQKKLEAADALKGKVEGVTDPVVGAITEAKEAEEARKEKEAQEKERRRQAELLNQIRRNGVESVL